MLPDKTTREEAAEFSVRKTLHLPLIEPTFEEGPPRRSDAFIEAFKKNVAEARQLEAQISDAQAQLERDLEPLLTQQILSAFRVSKLVDEGKVPQDHVDNFLADAGIKPHGNMKIACSPLIHAIVLLAESKGTPQFKRKKQRASTYASAIDFGIREGFTEEDFEAELRHPPTPGESHGIEYLAELGRAARRPVKTHEASTQAAGNGPYTITGDFSSIEPRARLMLVWPQGDTVVGALLDVSEKLLRRVLAIDAKSRRSRHQD
jgi:hypothetical protein